MTSLATHLPECARYRSLAPADRSWARAGARFRTSTGAEVSLPAACTAGAREMYCRNVYLRSGMTMPSDGWVVGLGANRGLFSVWAALTGVQVVAVEAQQGFASEIQALARHNGVADQVHIEGGEFAVIGAWENLDWLDRVGQLVLEVHRDFGDTASLVGRLSDQGFTVDLRDNDGARVGAGFASADYAYCQR